MMKTKKLLSYLTMGVLFTGVAFAEDINIKVMTSGDGTLDSKHAFIPAAAEKKGSDTNRRWTMPDYNVSGGDGTLDSNYVPPVR